MALVRKSPNSNAEISVGPKGNWSINHTPGTLVVPKFEKWASKVTINDHGEWTVSSLPLEFSTEFVHMYDATSSKNLTRFASDNWNILVAYDDGLFNDVAAVKKEFPGHLVTTVAVHLGDRADWIDCEAGNATQAEAIAAWQEELVKGIYADKSDWDLMLGEVQAREKTLKRKCLKWIADPNPNNVPHIPSWADACQYGFDSIYDVSLIRTSILREL